jgi:hypothetical protein
MRLPLILVMFALCLAAGGTFQPVSAQALDPLDEQELNVDYGILLRGLEPTVCIGDVLKVDVSIVSQVSDPDDENALAPESVVLGITAVRLRAEFSADILRGSSTPSAPIGSFSNAVPMEGTFEFTGIGSGRTTIKFSGEVENFLNRYPVSKSLAVRVIPCRLKVITNARWSQRLIGGKVTVYAVVYTGELVGDASGVYSGNGDVVWLMYAAIPGCAQTNTLQFGKVDLRGRIGKDDQITVDLTYAPMPASETVTCAGLGKGGGAIFANAAPLKASVPSYGGSVTLSQKLSGSAGVVPGKSYVYIVPIPDE